MKLSVWILSLLIVCFDKVYSTMTGPAASNWRETGSPAGPRGPPGTNAARGPPPNSGMSSTLRMPHSPGYKTKAPGGYRPGIMSSMNYQSPSIPQPTTSPVGAPGKIYPPGASRFQEPSPPGAPMTMKRLDEVPHRPGIRGAGWRPGGPSELAALMSGPKPEDIVRNMTIDQVILNAYGDINASLEAPRKDPENRDKILVELDMMLTAEQYRAFYGHSYTGRPGNDQDLSSADNSRGNHRDSRRHGNRATRGNRFKRKALKNTNLRWTDKVVPYEFVYGDFTNQEQAAIRAAMDQLELDSCVRFRLAEPWHYNRIRLQHGDGCNSAIGMVGGTQLVNLDEKGCRFRGLYLHELNHVLGRVHEHQLPDRDQHIVIMPDNVLPAIRQWFDPYAADTLDYFNQEYDLTSIMHYGETAFSIDGKSQTLRPRDSRQNGKIGKVFLQSQQSFVDKKVLNAMYNCSGHCDRSLRCSDGGFVNQFCACECADGSPGCQTTGRGAGVDKRVNCVNVESDTDCIRWAAEGECYMNPDWMAANCKKACIKCDPDEKKAASSCEDTDRQCVRWAGKGECDTNPSWMLHHCPAACGRCSDSHNCTDLHTEKRMCEYWSSGGECFKNPTWMVVNCRKSCNRCTGSCSNKNPDEDDCYKWARSGECSSNPTWMGEHCRKACGLCRDLKDPTPDATCIDRHGDRKCEEWEKRGECSNNAAWMSINCRRSCSRCTPVITKPTTPSNQPKPTKSTNNRDEEVLVPDPDREVVVSEDDVTNGTDTDQNDPDCFNTFKSDDKCIQWAKEEECTSNPAWMETNCKKSCKMCKKHLADDCLNRYVSDVMCDHWAATGECQTNKKWMLKQCHQSCTKCENYKPKDRICENEHKHDVECDDWSSSGECEANKAWMLNNCYKSCTKCKPYSKQNDTRPCFDLYPLAEECRSWMNTNQCTENRAWMMVNCYKTCSQCDPARDPVEFCVNEYPQDEHCDGKAVLGGCISNRVWMMQNCYKSCSECDGVRREQIQDRTCININGDTDCERWSKDGECTNNRFWMKVNCKKSCTDCIPLGGRTEVLTTVAPADCYNEYGNDVECNEWSADLECQFNKDWMMFYCKKSCLKCEGLPRTDDGPKECINKHDNDVECVGWFNDGECELNHHWMLDNCYQACTQCTPTEVRPPTTSAPTTRAPTRRPPPRRLPTRRPTTRRPATKRPATTRLPVILTPPPSSRCRNLHRSDKECYMWAQDGQCDRNPRWMTKNCQWSCSACDVEIEEDNPVCYDNEENCAMWAASNQCDISPGYMYLNCRRSCGLCDGGCVDRHSLCSRWAEGATYCAYNAGFMYPNCPRSCQIC